MGSSRENTGPPYDDAETIDTGTIYGDDMEYAYQDVVVPMVDGFVVQPIEATKVDNELPYPVACPESYSSQPSRSPNPSLLYSVTIQSLLGTAQDSLG